MFDCSFFKFQHVDESLQGCGLYIPSGWIYAERIVGSTCWLGIRVGILAPSLAEKATLEWLVRSWSQEDPIVKALLLSMQKALAVEAPAGPVIQPEKGDNEKPEEKADESKEEKKEEEKKADAVEPQERQQPEV